MTSSRAPWILAGVVTGLSGLATSYATATALGVRQSPIVAVAEWIIQITPGGVAESAISAVGQWDKPLLVLGISAFLLGAFAFAGALGRRRWWPPMLIFLALGAAGLASALTAVGSTSSNLLPVVVGLITWLLLFGWLSGGLASAGSGVTGGAGETRRGFLLRAGVLGVASVGIALGGRILGRGRQRVEAVRALLRLENATVPRIPRGAKIGLDGVTSWKTPEDTFYQIHTAIAVPAIDPATWRLRIHGMVERELELSYQDLLDREFTEAWITLNCVSNPVGGGYIGNAWWSGVRVAELLAEAGVLEGADAVLQTSEDGWTCGTPLMTLTDNRAAMLAVAMNGQPLPIDHGFPVRTVVPGLYGYVSACKWLVDLKVTRFDKFEAYWTTRGWAEQAPVKMSSRVDVPSSGDTVASGELRVGGVAWAQYTGIEAVEVALDGGPWQPAEIGRVPTNDTWVQWAATLTVGAGDHFVRVRATDKLGDVQTGVERDVLPDGATGWHTVDFTAEDG